MQFIADNQLLVTIVLAVIMITVIWWFEKRAKDIENKRKK